MHLRICNRFTPDPQGWLQLAPFGRHDHSEGPQAVTPATMTAVVNDYRSRGSPPLLVDLDHESHDPAKRTEAAGWIEELSVRNDGLYGRARWSPIGETAVKNGIYRFVSPVWDAERAADGTLLPQRLVDVGLTNQPNLSGLQPISNRRGDAAVNVNQPEKPTMKNVNQELGLAEDAPEASALAEIRKLKNRAGSAETERDALKTERDGLLAAQVEADLEKHAGVIRNRDAVKAQLLANRKGALDLLESIQAPAAPEKKEKPAPLTNRATAKAPDDAAQKSAQNVAHATRVANRAAQIQKEKSAGKRPYSFTAAFNEAAAELAAS